MASDEQSFAEEELTVIPSITSSPQSLSRAVHERRAEYTRPHKIKVKIGTWNVAACPGTHYDLGAWFVDGKGVDRNLTGTRISGGNNEDQSPNDIESVDAQEARRTKKESTVPIGDKAAVAGGQEIGLYVLGLQEVVVLTSAKEYIGLNDSGPINKWKTAILDALPPQYELVAEQQLSGLLMFIFASPTVAPTISSVSSVPVGTGMMGIFGNKGAVSTRIVLGETTRMVFVNSHLASGNDPAHLDRRCWDVSQIMARTTFAPISWAGVLEDKQESIGDEDFAFWFGDLNFRLEGLPGEDIRRLLMLHTKGEYTADSKSHKKIENDLEGDGDGIVVHHTDSDDSSEDESVRRTSSTFDHGDDASSTTLPDPEDFAQDPHSDPESLQATLDSLLPHDQLRLVQKTRKAFHDGWREGPITFLPTYKYDVGTMGVFDSSEKKRAPSWCDRILFRTRRDRLEYVAKTKEEELARIKDEEMKARGIDLAGDDESVLFEYDPDMDGSEESPSTGTYDEYDDGMDAMQPEEVVTKEGFMDKIQLDTYTSHQRVLSSDHKPLDAVFTLEYDAVVPELKSHIQAEVAKELDRAENEGRPTITVVIDHAQELEETTQSNHDQAEESSTDISEGVDFGEVGYQRRKSRYLTIANTGQVAAKFSFVSRPSISGVERVSPEWLSVKFAETSSPDPQDKNVEGEVVLEPGNTIHTTLEVFVDDISLVRSLNSGQSTLDDVLVLRVSQGRDYFIPIRGSWLQSCFGRSIEELIHIPEGGVRALLPKSNGTYVNRGQGVSWSAPRELFKLTEAVELLSERVSADENMIEGLQRPKEEPGWPFDARSWLLKDKTTRENYKVYVLEALDCDKSLIECFPPEIPAIERMEIMAEILIAFLGSISDGVVPETLWVKLEQERTAQNIEDVEEQKAWVLDVLSVSPNHSISFVFLTSMLSKVAAENAPASISRAATWGSSAKSGMDSVRRSLSFRGKPPSPPPDLATTRRQEVDKKYAEILAPVVFRVPLPQKDKDRRAVQDRMKDVLEIFLRSREYG
ncbi:phosphatase family protein-like protein [Coleophoma cylindrospora]|uniref:Phosphatase family protein-like protein n=1 Tax=Coleophoma cylindrospora TaxID=1849047 RepID=A0A3D8SQC9_9HELO|nr:phosphatase family protein-like protein [Coleophoma cylindrospora]